MSFLNKIDDWVFDNSYCGFQKISNAIQVKTGYDCFDIEYFLEFLLCILFMSLFSFLYVGLDYFLLRIFCALVILMYSVRLVVNLFFRKIKAYSGNEQNPRRKLEQDMRIGYSTLLCITDMFMILICNYSDTVVIPVFQQAALTLICIPFVFIPREYFGACTPLPPAEEKRRRLQKKHDSFWEREPELNLNNQNQGDL